MAEKRVIEYEAASELANDDWLLIDGVTEGTRKARPSTVTAELGQQVTNIASTVGGLIQVTMGHEQSFAPSYDESTSYDVGDLVMKYACLYKCTAPTTGTWDSSKWQLATVSEQLEESGKIDDVQVNGVSVVTDKVARIDLTGMQADIDSKQADTKIGGTSILDNNKVANLDFLASYGEASGSIASFNDGAAMPLKSLKVGIEPVQDLHGYDGPWVGGAGKNKFDKSTVNVDKYIGADGQLAISQYNQDVTDFIPVTSGQSYIINSSISTNHYSCFYDENKNVVGSVFANNQFPKVAPSDAKYIRVTFAKADINTFMVEQGTTASSTYYPYSNICPISGWSAVNVTRTGKNLFDPNLGRNETFNTLKNALTYYKNNNKYATGYIDTTDIRSNSSYTTFFAPVKSGVTYTIKCYANSAFSRVLYLDNDGEIISSSGGWKIEYTHTALENERYIAFSYGSDMNPAQLEIGDTATTYEPYSGTTYTTTLKDGQGNPMVCYGGTLDVVSGELVVDRVMTKFNGSEDWVNVGGSYPFAFQLDTYLRPNSKNQICISSLYPWTKVEVPTNNAIRWQIDTPTGRLYVYDYTYTSDLTGFKAMLQTTPLQVCYNLATPQTIQLTPTAVKSLLGTNNLWADSGDILECKYVRDNSAVINDLIARVTALENA